MNTSPTHEPLRTDAPPQSLQTVIARVAGAICSDKFPNGDRAALRRMVPGHPPPTVFYGFADRHLSEGWERRLDDWLALVSGIAIMVPASHAPGEPLGRALAAENYSQLRLERLLSSHGATARTLLLRAARMLAARQHPFDWAQAAALLLTRDPDRRENIRMRIALDYHRERRKNEAQGQDEATL